MLIHDKARQWVELKRKEGTSSCGHLKTKEWTMHFNPIDAGSIEAYKAGRAEALKELLEKIGDKQKVVLVTDLKDMIEEVAKA